MTSGATARLHTLTVGTGGPRVAFLHGLFGQGRNWARIAKALSGPDGTGARCLLVDLPDHGRSPWTEEFSFEAYAGLVAETLSAAAPGEQWVLVGHSLGGKVAMVLTLDHPELVVSLVVVDIAPKNYGNLHRFSHYMDAMRALPLTELTGRADAEERFATVDPDPTVRGFLLQNLRRHGDTWTWQANLDLLAADAARGADSRIAAFPATGDPAFDGPVVWLVGGDSPYVSPEDGDQMRALFPRTRLVTVKGVGHWVHSEAPEVVTETIRRAVAASTSG